MPVIAVTPFWDDEKGRIGVNNDYLEAVIRAGGSPVLMPLTDNEKVVRDILQSVDGLLLSGGADVSPSVYKEEKLPCCGENAPARDLMEGWCIHYAMQRRLPILGICRGMQILNCVLGGSLYQDIATRLRACCGNRRRHPSARGDRSGRRSHQFPPSSGRQKAGPQSSRHRLCARRHHRSHGIYR